MCSFDSYALQNTNSSNTVLITVMEKEQFFVFCVCLFSVCVCFLCVSVFCVCLFSVCVCFLCKSVYCVCLFS